MASIPTFRIDLNPTMGPTLIGLICAAVFHGITTLQTIFYYTTYPKDRAFFKGLVALLWMLDTLSLAMIAYTVYTYLVLDFMNPLALLTMNWGVAAEPVVSATIAFAVHIFMIHRVWILNKKLAPIAAVLVLISLFSYSLSFVAVYYTVGGDTTHVWTVEDPRLHWITITALVTTTFVDLVVTFTICWQLYTTRTGFELTDRIIVQLTMYTITSGLLPSIVSVASLISSLASPQTFIIEAFNAVQSKAYANALLATLNSRRSVANHAMESRNKMPDPQVLTPMQFSRKVGRPSDVTGTSGECDISSTKAGEAESMGFGPVINIHRQSTQGMKFEV